MRKITLLTMIAATTGCIRDRPLYTAAPGFNLPRIERELNFYVATHSLRATNHFFAYPTEFQHGEPIRAMVYWKEERTLLPYNELEPDSMHDVLAWRG